MKRTAGVELKARSDGMINVSLDKDALDALDAAIEKMVEERFRPTRSQGLKRLLKKMEKPL